jgi:hypothetical protein
MPRKTLRKLGHQGSGNITQGLPAIDHRQDQLIDLDRVVRRSTKPRSRCFSLASEIGAP